VVLKRSSGGPLRGGLMGLGIAAALIVPSTGLALADDAPVVTRAPDISGTPQVGQTLHAVHGAWGGSSDAAENYTWVRCPDQDFEDCSTIQGATGTSYTVANEDVGDMIRVTLTVSLGDDSDHRTSDPTDVVTKASGGTTTQPGTNNGPSFTISAPTKAAGVAPAGVKLIKPRPVVKISGKYTSTGAKITLLTVSSPKGATVKVACTGHCPAKSQTLKAGTTAHATKFQRTLKSGTKLKVTVSRKGYVSYITTLTIRARKAPSRSDSCLLPGRTKTQRCPAS
jgi:hypothetical protein